MDGDPVQVPLAQLSVCPASGVPEMDGAIVLWGGHGVSVIVEALLRGVGLAAAKSVALSFVSSAASSIVAQFGAMVRVSA
jgi:hypothetical protein